MKGRWFITFLLVLASFLAQSQNTFTQEDRERLVRLEVKLEEMQTQMDLRFEAVDNRFGDVNNRFEDINSRLDQQFNLILGVLAAFVTMFVSTISFAIWDRKQAMRPILDETQKLSKDVSKLNQLLEALKELGKSDDKLKEVLKQFNLF